MYLLKLIFFSCPRMYLMSGECLVEQYPFLNEANIEHWVFHLSFVPYSTIQLAEGNYCSTTHN